MQQVAEQIKDQLYWSAKHALNHEQIKTYFKMYANLATYTDHKERTILHYAAREDVPWLIEHLVQVYNVNINAPDIYGWTPLHEAIADRPYCTQSVEKLMELGANLGIKDNNQYTPLDLVSKEDRVEWCKNSCFNLLHFKLLDDFQDQHC